MTGRSRFPCCTWFGSSRWRTRATARRRGPAMRNNESPSFAERLAAIRESRGLLRSELARAAGISGAQVTRLEQGIRQPTLPTLQALARALEVQVEELGGIA